MLTTKGQAATFPACTNEYMKWLAVLKPLPWLSESAKRQILKQIQSATMSGSRLPH